MLDSSPYLLTQPQPQKPGNVLINGANSGRPVAKLTDFGLSRLRHTVRSTAHPLAGTVRLQRPPRRIDLPPLALRLHGCGCCVPCGAAVVHLSSNLQTPPCARVCPSARISNTAAGIHRGEWRLGRGCGSWRVRRFGVRDGPGFGSGLVRSRACAEWSWRCVESPTILLWAARLARCCLPSASTTYAACLLPRLHTP